MFLFVRGKVVSDSIMTARESLSLSLNLAGLWVCGLGLLGSAGRGPAHFVQGEVQGLSFAGSFSASLARGHSAARNL